MTSSAVILQHLSFEDLGSFEPVLADHGFKIDTVQLGVDELAWVGEPDLLVVLGGPISVNDSARFPLLRQERELVHARLLADRPCLGICLGAQMMALALGARVSSMARKEIGWSALSFSEQLAIDDPLRALEGVDVLHWHGEQFTVPDGALPLASSALCANQAFSWGRNGLALQFHPEVHARALERWYIGHVEELTGAGCDIATLRTEGQQRSERLVARAQSFFDRWLTQRGL